VTLYFAYGSNMSRPAMARRCPQAVPLGVAMLEGFRFIIGADGFASVAPAAGARVHGVLWRLTARDLAALNAYESVDSGLYVRRTLTVRFRAQRLPALTYVSPRRGEGAPRPGHMAQVLEAARDWGLPHDYVRALARWSPAALAGARAREAGEIG
jgi:cation transport regulator ChaC